MRNRKLEDYIASLSEGEKTEYKQLIDECLKRDIEIKKNFNDAIKRLGSLKKVMQKQNDMISALNSDVEELYKSLICRRYQDYPVSTN